MLRFAVIAPPFQNHIRAIETLATQLINFGHAVIWIYQADVQEILGEPRIEFCVVCSHSYPAGSLQLMLSRTANPSGVIGLQRGIDDVAKYIEMLCLEGLEIIRAKRITAAIADQMEAARGLLADAFSLPFISVACALPVNRENAVPLPVMPWAYVTDQRALELNKSSSSIYDWMMKPHSRVIEKLSKKFGLPLKSTLADCLSPLAQLSQTTSEFDFPRTCLPAYFYHVGPLRSNVKTESPLNFPVNPLRTFVFASLGMLKGGRFGLFKRIARACMAVQVQLLVVYCNYLNTRQERLLRQASATWVTGFANQHAAVHMADVGVKHGGLNTVLNALAAGTRLLVLPIAFDQPGVAARVVHAKADSKLPARWASESSVATALSRVINEPTFAASAARLGRSFALAGGAHEASRIVLSAVAGCPALRTAASKRAFLYVNESPVYAA